MTWPVLGLLSCPFKASFRMNSSISITGTRSLMKSRKVRKLGPSRASFPCSADTWADQENLMSSLKPQRRRHQFHLHTDVIQPPTSGSKVTYFVSPVVV